MRYPKPLPTLVCALLALVVVATLPAAANAGARQLSLLQDDAELFGQRPGEDPVAAMKEIKELGVDVIRTNVIFYRIYPEFSQRTKPAGFDPSNPDSPEYHWFYTDRLVTLARQNGMRVLMTITGPGPFWATTTPGKCRTNRVCPWNPNAKVFGQFAEAVAKRYRGKVDWYSIYNEPNIGSTPHTQGWLMPQAKRTKAGRVETVGVMYRKLWQAGYKAIAKHDPARRNRVLFGEVAAISEPLPKLYAALCLDRDGKPFKGAMRRAHECGRVSKLNIGGWAIHPYNQGGFGPPNRKTSSKTALPQQYIPRLHRLMKQAASRGRVPGGRGIYITEFGYQTNPPDRISTITPKRHGQYLNESDRLFYGDSRIKMVSQYQLVDVNDVTQYNSGIRFAGGREKASYPAYRMPIVVTRRSASLVEVYGQVRPARQARLINAFAAPELQFAPRGGSFRTIRRPGLNPVGIFRIDVRRSGAAAGRWRLKWNNTLIGETSYSRVATAGKPLRYYRD